jgi:predicted aminopeptidase
MTYGSTHGGRLYPAVPTLLLLLAILLAGCSPSYVLRLAMDQLRIQSRSVPVERALEDPALDAREKEKLRLVARIKAFGERELGLTRSDNYETVYLGGEPNPVYTVTAAHRTRLELVTWWFPVVGRMPYLGFFDPEDAAEKKRELEGEGLDVVVWPAEAYSTLGWFQDPVHRNLLGKDVVDLSDTLLHEMTHATLYAKGQPAFNETLASVVGRRGAHAFLEKDFGPESPEALRAAALIRDERRFSRFVDRLMTRLSALYDRTPSDEEALSERERLFAEVRIRFRVLEREYETERFEGFGAGEINNAYLLAVALYHRHYNLFESVIEARDGSIPEALELFRRLSEQEGDLVRATEEWLR